MFLIVLFNPISIDILFANFKHFILIIINKASSWNDIDGN